MEVDTITIDRHIAMSKADTGQPKRKYPFPGMDVGDSFFVPARERDRKLSLRLIAAAAGFAKKSGAGMKFSLRWIDITDPRYFGQRAPGYRVWRVS